MTDTTSPVLLDTRHLKAARRLQEILVAEKFLADEKSSVKKILAEVLTEVGQQAIDDDGVVVAQVKAGSLRFNAEEARRNLHPKLLALIVQEVPDPALAKELLPPTEYAKCCKATAPSIISA